jgi:SEC-C motif-containing protein
MTGPALPTLHCPCGSPVAYARCCGRLHRGAAEAATAEELMRSRYSAFAVGDDAWLLRSWHPDTRPATINRQDDQRWTGLHIVRIVGGTADDTTGQVEFEAAY